MVLALFVMIGIAVVDRILYSTYTFMSRKAVDDVLGTNKPLNPTDQTRPLERT